MGTNSNIQWCDHTWNPWQGCTRVSDGCVNCYMYSDMIRYGKNPQNVIRSLTPTFNKPLLKDRKGNWKWAPASVIFCGSWTDIFHEAADAWRAEFWDIITQRPDLIFIILTKRPERIVDHLPDDWGRYGWSNVVLGFSAENQETFDRRYEQFSGTPNINNVISLEPLLDGISLKGRLDYIDWVIVGGESGSNARPMNINWAANIVAQCKIQDTPIFVKQLGAHPYITQFSNLNTKATALQIKDKKGGDISEWPNYLQVQEHPFRGLVK